MIFSRLSCGPALAAGVLTLGMLVAPLASATNSPTADAGVTVRERVGHAYDRMTGELRYTESHTETLRDGRVVTDEVAYRDPKGEVFATKKVDFAHTPLRPDFRFENSRTGHLEAFDGEGDAGEVAFRRRHDAELERATQAGLAHAVVDAGFDRLIETRWEDLARGHAIRMDFLIPSELGTFAFRVRRDDAPGAGPGDILLEMDSFLLRMLAPTIRASYDPATRRLQRYVGTSNVRDADGRNLDVRIEFGPTRLVSR